MSARTLIARTIARQTLRPVQHARCLVKPGTLAAINGQRRTLTSSAVRLESTPLSSKLMEEIKFEADNAQDSEPEFLKEFKQNSVWAIVDEPGADEITLTRNYGNENIRLLFSISDLDAEPEADETYLEEGEEEGATTSSADTGSGGVGEEATGGPTDESFPVETSITITKQGVPGALSIDAVAQDGMFTINNISFYNDADLATGMTSEDDWKRQGLYMGPAFDNLDEGVQSEFENFLEERGIDSSLALFIPDLAEYKEYISWLNSVHKFVEA
ncbi:Mitochondrial acidic protein mam33 [Microbotryomycetes sp. JL221]|nr:Mitochondrial acidic protein mam33 [Microbotryomycetes sp. JL221]